MAIENLLINVDHGGELDIELAGLLALATDMKESITGVWQALDSDIFDKIELDA